MSVNHIKDTTHRFSDVAGEASYSTILVNNIKDTTHRFSDVAGEPCIMLLPIEGFNRKPLVTLEEATIPLTDIVPRISTYVYIAKQRVKNPANDLSVDESASIALYTMEWEPYTDSLYYILNDTLRTEDRSKLKPWFSYLKLILTALSRLPSISLTIYRGVRSETEHDYEQYQIGAQFVWWGFSSCSQSRRVSEKDQFFGETSRRTLFIIDCIKGKDISNHSYFRKEQEVLLLPATKVKVINNEHRKHDSHIIRLEEYESSYIFLEPVSSEEEIASLKKRPTPSYSSPPPKGPTVESDRYYFNSRLSKDISRFKHRSDATLTGRRLNENDIKIVVQQLIIMKQCQRLSLRESKITSQGAILISEALRNNNTLESLSMSDNEIGDLGAQALAHSLSNNNNVTLKQLCLRDNGITDKGVEYLADMLETNTTLTHLRLPNNEISHQGLKRLAEVLTSTNKTLQELSLEWNKFGNDANVDILVGMLNNNKSLTLLNLNSCKLSKPGIKQLKDIATKKKNFELKID